MWTTEIEKILSKDRFTGPVFGGVYACDQLPEKLPPNKHLYVANTDPANKSGQHWVLFYFRPDGHCLYFDSFGLAPIRPSFIQFMESNAESWTYNMRRLQDPRSTVCGFYCIFFGVHLCRGMNMEKIVSMFDVNKKFNDLMVRDFVNKYYGSVKRLNSSAFNQNCCCALDSRFLTQYYS